MPEPINLDKFLQAPSASVYLASTPIKVLVEWFLTDCEARNLQPETLQFYHWRLQLLVDTLGEKRADEVSTAHLRALAQGLREVRGWNAQNTNHAIQVWKGFFNYLEREEVITNNPVRRLKKLRLASTFPIPFSSEEIEAILNSTPGTFNGIRDRTMILVLLDTDVRVGELMSLSSNDIDLATGQMRVFGKGRKERLVPFEKTVRRALIRYSAIRETVVKATVGKECDNGAMHARRVRCGSTELHDTPTSHKIWSTKVHLLQQGGVESAGCIPAGKRTSLVLAADSNEDRRTSGSTLAAPGAKSSRRESRSAAAPPLAEAFMCS